MDGCLWILRDITFSTASKAWMLLKPLTNSGAQKFLVGSRQWGVIQVGTISQIICFFLQEPHGAGVGRKGWCWDIRSPSLLISTSQQVLRAFIPQFPSGALGSTFHLLCPLLQKIQG